MRVCPARSPENPAMRSKRVLRLTLTVIVPRSESRRRNVRALRLTDRIRPSYSRSWDCVAGAADRSGAAAPAVPAPMAATVVSAAVTRAMFKTFM